MVSNQPSLTAVQLADRLGGALEGDGTLVIRTVATLDDAGPDTLSWVGKPAFAPQLSHTKAGVVLVSEECPVPSGRTIIRVPDPDQALIEVLTWLAPAVDRIPEGVHPTATVHPDAVVEGASIAANVYIGAGSSVGAGTQLHPGVYVGAETQIGCGCVLWPNVVVRERATIGDRVIIHPNTTIGADGFSYLQRGGKHRKIPQIGTVEIRDDVEIWANCAIDRARSGVTRIGRGTKLDNLVQIGHNADIGEGCIIIAQCGIGGSTTLGSFVMLGGQVGLKDHVRIGNRVRVAAKSGVAKDIPDGQVLRGDPATRDHEFLRQEACVRKLPEWMGELRTLKRQVAELEARMNSTPSASPRREST